MVKWNVPTACMTLLVINRIFVNASHDIEVLLNDSASIDCSPNEPMDIQWHHKGHMKPRVLFYAGRNFYPPYKGRFQIGSDNYSLLIPSVNSDDAGLYECSEEISGRLLNSVQLTVLESIPLCGSNMTSKDFVGPSTCNLEQEYMIFTCVVSFNGKPPQMIWTTLNDNRPKAFTESTCKTENGRSNCSLILKADSKYDGSIFTCQSRKSSANCSTEIIKVQYFESDSNLVVEKNIDDKVNCSVKSNQILHFKWTQLQGNQYVTLIKDQTLLIQSHGFYRCIVEYRIRNAKCSAFGSEVFVSTPSIICSAVGQPGTAVIIVLSLIVVIFIVSGIIIFVLNRFQVNKLKRKDMDELENNLHKSREFVKDIIDIDSGLIEKLRAKGVLNMGEIEEIQAKNIRNRRNLLLLDIISTKKKNPELCNALNDTGQQHIVNYIKACGVYDEKFADEWPLTDTDIRSIDSNYDVLVDLQDIDEILEMLFEAGVINRRQREFISLKPTSFERNEGFLKILRKTSLRGYKTTIFCLRKSNRNEIADILETGEASNSTGVAMTGSEMCRIVRTVYQCTAENDDELSFQPNQIILNAHPSDDPGWLIGTLNGKDGLIPENYIEYLT